MSPLAESFFAAAVLAMIVLTATTSLRGFLRRRPDTSQVRGSAMLGPDIRSWYFENLQPLEDALAARSVSATAVTAAQMVLSLGIGLAYAQGWLFLAGWLVLAIGSLDIIDGRLARRTGTASDRGAFLDSVFDRYADTFAYMGLAVYFRDSWMLWTALFTLLGTAMVSYTRARAEALQADCSVGSFQRPERTVVLGFGTMFSVLFDRIAGHWAGLPPDGLLVAVLVVLAVMTNVSAVQRILHVDRELGG